MTVDGERSLERALADTEVDADAALKAANGVVKALRRFHGAARNGNLRDLRPAIAASERSTSRTTGSTAIRRWCGCWGVTGRCRLTRVASGGCGRKC
jgi:hypothetical protein